MGDKDLSYDDLALRSLRSMLLRPYRLAALALAVGHFLFLMVYFEPAMSGPDANGYLKQAQLIADHGRTWFELESPLQYVGVHWLKTEDDRRFSRYPPGLPAILAIPFKLGGPTAALLVNPILTSLTLLGLFMVCGLWIGEGWGFAAMAAMALNPIVNTFALTGDSHAATAFFLVWGLYFLLARWSKTRSPRWAFFIGLWLGMIPTIRYPEALFVPAAGVFMVLHLGRDRKVWKSLVAAFVGALIPISYLMIRNQMVFGAFWKTAYSLTNEQTGFAWTYFVQHVVPYLQGIQAGGVGLFAALGLAGMAALCIDRDTRRQGLLLLSLVVPITLLYMAYYFAPGGIAGATMRFLLPTFYVYVIAGVWVVKMMAEHRPKGAYAATLAVLVVTACWGIPQSIHSLSRLRRTNGVLAAISRVVTEHAERGAIVIAAPPIQQHLDFIGRWRLADESLFQVQTRMPLFPRFGEDRDTPRPRPLSQLEEKQRTMERYMSPSGTGLSDVLLDDLDAWAQRERKVYWVGSLEDIKDRVPSSDSLHVVAKIELPRMDRGELGLGGPFPGRPGPPMPGGRLGRDEELRAMLEDLIAGGRFGRDGPLPGMFRGPMAGGRSARGGVFGGPQRGMTQMLLGGQELVLAEWTRSLHEEH